MAQLPQPGGGQRSESKFIVFENFEKMNTQSIRQSLKESELAWLENLQPIAPNNLLTVPAPAAAALATIPAAISVIFYADIGGTDTFIVFAQNGSAYAVNIATGAINNFAPAGTFSSQPDCTTWQASRVLINDPVSGYCTFDGTLFVTQGGVSPNIPVTDGGSGYGAAPTVTISGGTGTGATAVAVVENGAVVAVNLTKQGKGYVATDALTVAFGTSPGSGATGTATMTGAQVASLSIANAGNFSSSRPAGTYALAFSGGGGTGAAGTATVVQTGFNLFKVASVQLYYGGKNYTSAPTATLSGVTAGTAPSFTVGIGTQSVASLTLTAGGSSYTAPPEASIVPPDGEGSGAEAVTTETGGVVQTLTLVPSALATILIATGGNYTSSAGSYALSFSGGGGTGATGTATLAVDPSGVTNNIVCTQVFLTSGGSNYTSSPTVTVSGVTGTQATFLALTASQGAGYDTTANVLIGAGTGATAIAHVWPFIPSGTTLAIFQGRVWLGGSGAGGGAGNLLQWTGTGATYGNVGYDDFLEADASGSLTISDADLVHQIVALRALNNYLWIVGDQSIKQIGNISIVETDVTSFTILTISSDQGTIYKYSCVSFNRVFLFVNNKGIYGVFGSSVQKLSPDLDGIFELIDFTLQPQGALADINAIHNAVFLVRYVDPVLGERSILLTFNGQKWFVTAQGNSLMAIATAPTLSSDADSLYGSSGTDLTGLFSSTTTPVAFKIQTSLTHHGNAVQRKKTLRAGFTATLANGSGQITQTVEAAGKQLKPGSSLETLSAQRNLVAGFQTIGFADENVEVSGVYLGQTLTGTLAGLTITNLINEYQEQAMWK